MQTFVSTNLAFEKLLYLYVILLQNKKLRYNYFRFGGRHLGLPTSGMVGDSSQWIHSIAGPCNMQKHAGYLLEFRVLLYNNTWGVSHPNLTE